MTYEDESHPFPLHGLTGEQAALIRVAAGKCQNKGCKNLVNLALDHDHFSGDLRGVLCTRCNNTLGVAHDDAARLRGLAEYLENPPIKGIKVNVNPMKRTRKLTEQFFKDIEVELRLEEVELGLED